METEFLDPQTTLIERAPDNTLRVMVPDVRCGLKVEVLRAFPLSHPDENIVLRDGGGAEIGVLRRLADVPQPARGLLEEQLRRRYFLPRITKILDISERFGSAVWEVETDRGPRHVVTEQLHEALHEMEAGRRFLLTDADGNRYEIKDLRELDEESQARFLGKL
jgi:hypothetical protein